jgi:uncharacterized protein (TIGR02300 family)
MSCGAKFYDLNRDPAICPKCGTGFHAVALSRVAAPVVVRAAAPAPEDETELEQTGPELVSLDEVEAGEAEKDLPIDDDIDVGDAADDTFLEEEEEGEDDVADLIDGDIEDDEEA